MAGLAHFLFKTGTASFHIFWIPLAYWTLLAAVTIGGLKLFELRIAPVVHYYGRAALIWGLPLGVFGSILFRYWPSTSATSAQSSAKLFVIHSSTITPAAAGAALHWTNPFIWLGALTLGALALAAVGSIKLMAQWISLGLFIKRLPPGCAMQDVPLSDLNRHRLKQSKAVSLHFSRDVEVPCTFGWFSKQIILPQHLRRQKEKLNMALRHELMHIANGDYPLNAGIQLTKALFWFHPLTHGMICNLQEYREVYCDQQVLCSKSISQKEYARLLLDLSRKPVFKPVTAVNMAVKPSTLKKRIQAMKTSTPTLPSLKWSITLMTVFTLLIAGFVACSDVSDDGITRSEVHQTQSKINTLDDPSLDGKMPLYIVNGKKMQSEEDKDMLVHLKSKYIKSITVLKSKQARQTYGKKAKNGAVSIQLIDGISRKEAFNDPRKIDATQETTKNGESIYVSVDQQPKPIGGQQAINSHISYPEKCKQAGAEGRVIIQFIITKKGNVENPKVVKGIGHGCDDAAINAIKQSKWKPGRQNGKAVNAQFNWVVTFRLSDNDSSAR